MLLPPLAKSPPLPENPPALPLGLRFVGAALVAAPVVETTWS
jgi:hypothetical protein